MKKTVAIILIIMFIIANNPIIFAIEEVEEQTENSSVETISSDKRNKCKFSRRNNDIIK